MTTKKTEKYFEGVGRRKTSVARVRITPSSKNVFEINGKPLVEYFPTKEMQRVVADAIQNLKTPSTWSVSAKLSGGGIHSQSEALRHGLSRALLKFDERSTKESLKPLGFLKRDPRAKERRKFGLKKARKAPQWSKR